MEESKMGKPKGLTLRSLVSVLTVLVIYKDGINLKNLVEKARMNRKTVISVTKELVGKGNIEKIKVGRERVYKITPKGFATYERLRKKQILKEVKALNFDRLLRLARKGKVKVSEVGEKLLKDENFAKLLKGEKISDGKRKRVSFNRILRDAITEVIEEKRRKRIIELK